MFKLILGVADELVVHIEKSLADKEAVSTYAVRTKSPRPDYEWIIAAAC